MPIVVTQNAPAQDVLYRPDGRPIELRSSPMVMGVLNLTPDSFSDGGRWTEPEIALTRALSMIEQGAEILDLGAESTRPGGGVYGSGAETITPEEELARLLPILELIRSRTDLPISVDTRKAAVARAALDHGADLINDISALQDPDMGQVVASAGCPVVLMHSRGNLHSMQTGIEFDDLISEVAAELESAMSRSLASGIQLGQIVLDPGIGFGKTVAQNLLLLRNLDRFRSLGRPLLIGASRKSFIGELIDEPAARRLPGSLAAASWATRQGAAILRVHDVAETVHFLRVWNAIAGAFEEESV